MFDSAASAARSGIRASAGKLSRRRRWLKLSLTTAILTGVCLWQAVTTERARAASLTPDTNIVGLRTTMTQDQVKQSIQQQFGTSDFPAQTIKFGTSDYTRDLILSFTADVTSAQDKAANQLRVDAARKATQANAAAGCTSPLCQGVVTGLVKDTVTIDLDPTEGSTVVLAINRQTDYPKDQQVLEQVFVQSLIDKYGKPSWKDIYGHEFYWVDNGLPTNLTGDCSRFAELVADPRGQFSTLMNLMGRNSLKPPRCVMYLKVSIISVARSPAEGGDFNTKYVTGLRMTLVNVRNSYAALSRFAADFWAAAESARQKTISVQSQIKPKF